MMQFEQELTPEQREMVKELGQHVVAEDGRTFLLNKIGKEHRRRMRKIVRATQQSPPMEFPDLGRIVTMRDGSRYEVTARGWKKL